MDNASIRTSRLLVGEPQGKQGDGGPLASVRGPYLALALAPIYVWVLCSPLVEKRKSKAEANLCCVYYTIVRVSSR